MPKYARCNECRGLFELTDEQATEMARFSTKDEVWVGYWKNEALCSECKDKARVKSRIATPEQEEIEQEQEQEQASVD